MSFELINVLFLKDVFPKTSKITYRFFRQERKKEYFKQLNKKVVDAYYFSNKICYPAFENIFKAYELTPFEKVKVVIIGQDPYTAPGQAIGLSFATPKGKKVQPSLINIYKEIQSDIGIKVEDRDGVLDSWCKQGVFLLNTTLTVFGEERNSHYSFAWYKFTDATIKYLSDNFENIVFILWGGPAKKKSALIDKKKHCVLEGAHPSPLSQHLFTGCKHFSKCNEYLKKNGKDEIKW